MVSWSAWVYEGDIVVELDRKTQPQKILDWQPDYEWIRRIDCLSCRSSCGLPHFSPLLQLLINVICQLRAESSATAVIVQREGSIGSGFEAPPALLQLEIIVRKSVVAGIGPRFRDSEYPHLRATARTPFFSDALVSPLTGID